MYQIKMIIIKMCFLWFILSEPTGFCQTNRRGFVKNTGNGCDGQKKSSAKKFVKQLFYYEWMGFQDKY